MLVIILKIMASLCRIPPILVGCLVREKLGRSPGSWSLFAAPSHTNLYSGYAGHFHFTVAGPRWIFTNFPFKSYKKRHPFPYIIKLLFPLLCIIAC